MTGVLLAPHNDDEALFAAHTCLRHHPRVIVCLRSFIEAGWPNGPTFQERELETAAACEILGCEYEQRTYPDSDPPWDDLREDLQSLEADMVWAPLPEPGGHPHHNAIGEMAVAVFEHVVFYSTYTHARGKTTTGDLVRPEAEWEEIKRRAMDCYVSQANHPMTQAAFNEWAIDEYLTAA